MDIFATLTDYDPNAIRRAKLIRNSGLGMIPLWGLLCCFSTKYYQEKRSN